MVYVRYNCIMPIFTMAMLAGCAANYAPIGENKVFVDSYFLMDSSLGSGQALLCSPDEQVCGRREADGYDPDEFIMYTDDDIKQDLMELSYLWQAGKTRERDMQTGRFEMIGILAEAGDTIRTRLNDLSFAEVTVPPRFRILEPTYDAQLSRKLADVLSVTWEPSSQGFPLYWKLFLADKESEEMPCDLLGWKAMEGEAEDTGNLQISLQGMPEDLPPEGCEAVLVLRLRNEGTLPPEYPSGYVRSEMLDGVVFRLMP